MVPYMRHSLMYSAGIPVCMDVYVWWETKTVLSGSDICNSHKNE